MRSVRVALTTILVPVVVGSSPARAIAQNWVTGDSVVLTRGPCFGSCPAYRLRVGRNGAVRIELRSPSNVNRVESAARGPALWESLARELERAGFRTWPIVTTGEAPFCRVVATDHPSIEVAWYAGARSYVRRYDLGCRVDGPSRAVVVASTERGSRPQYEPQPYSVPMRALADSIDRVVNTAVWLRKP